MKMKILFVNYEYKPQCGGAGFAIYNLASELHRMGHTVHILAGWDDTYGKPECIQGVHTEFVKIRKKNIHQSTATGMLGFVCRGLWKIYRMTRDFPYDIVQFYFSVPTGLLKYGLCGKLPYVVSLRGMDVPGFHKDKYSLLTRIMKPLNRRIVKEADAVTVLSSEFKKYFQRFEAGVEPVIIPNGLS